MPDRLPPADAPRPPASRRDSPEAAPHERLTLAESLARATAAADEAVRASLHGAGVARSGAGRTADGVGDAWGDRGGHPELFRLLVESQRDHAIFALDPDGTIRTWPPAATSASGFRSDEMIGRPRRTRVGASSAKALATGGARPSTRRVTRAVSS